MNTYKNKDTGAIILTDSELGGVWELISAKTSKKTSKKPIETKKDEE